MNVYSEQKLGVGVLVCPVCLCVLCACVSCCRAKVRALVAKPDDLSAAPKTHLVERTDSHVALMFKDYSVKMGRVVHTCPHSI